MTQSVTSSEESRILPKVMKSGLARWNLETLTGLLGIQSLQQHQRETAKNQAAENRHVRRSVWGSEEPEEDVEGMHSQTILGDVTHPTPIVISPPQSGGLGKVLAAGMIAAGLLGIPAAGIGGYFLSQYLDRKNAPVDPAIDNTVDIGLRRWSDIAGNQ